MAARASTSAKETAEPGRQRLERLLLLRLAGRREAVGVAWLNEAVRGEHVEALGCDSKTNQGISRNAGQELMGFLRRQQSNGRAADIEGLRRLPGRNPQCLGSPGGANHHRRCEAPAEIKHDKRIRRLRELTGGD